MPDCVLHHHDVIVAAREGGLRGKRLVQDAEAEVAHSTRVLVDRVVVVLLCELMVLDKVADDLAQERIDTLVHAEAEAQLDLEDEVGAEAVDRVLERVRLVCDRDVQEPVGTGTLRALVEDRVEDVAVELVRRGVVRQEHEVVCRVVVGGVVPELCKLADVVLDGKVDGLRALDGGATAPDEHDKEDQRCHEHGEVAAMHELRQAREEECGLEDTEEHEEDDRADTLVAHLRQVRVQQDRCHEHRQGNCQAVGCFHVRRGLEEQYDEDAGDPHDVVDQRNVELALRLGRIGDLHVRQEVQPDCLGDDGVGAGDERLGGDDGGKGRKDDGEGTPDLRKHLEERVHVRHRKKRRVGPVCKDPGALAKVVQDQAALHEWPGSIDVRLADVSHIGVEGLGAGRAEEDVAQDHHACSVLVREQECDRAERVQGAQDVQVCTHVEKAGEAEEQEPYRHDRAEQLADARGAGTLDHEQDAEDDDRDADHDMLVVAYELASKLDGPESLDSGRDRDGRCQDAICQKGSAADHGGDDEPLRAAAHEAVEREDAALALVVRLHCDEDILDSRDQGDRPDDEGQSADDHIVVDRGQAAVAGDDGLDRVHRRCADVAVDDAERDQDHAHGQRNRARRSLLRRARGCTRFRTHADTPNCRMLETQTEMTNPTNVILYT